MSINWKPIENIVNDKRISPKTELLLHNKKAGDSDLYYARAFYTKRGNGYLNTNSLIDEYSHYVVVTAPVQEAIGKKLAQEESFSMFDGWQPGGSFPEKILHEFKSFWCAKPEVKRTQEQWMKYLLLSYNYAVNRDMANKPDTSTGWWRDGELSDD